MKVTAGRFYFYYPSPLDQIDGRTSLVPGSIVKVVKLPGCPPPNSCGHCHVEYAGKFAGLVSIGSLFYIFDAVKGDITR